MAKQEIQTQDLTHTKQKCYLLYHTLLYIMFIYASILPHLHACQQHITQ
jgi:hypothetical protein